MTGLPLSQAEADGRVAIAHAHSTTVAAAWYGISRVSLANWLSKRGAGLPRHRPTNAQLRRSMWRTDCPCVMCVTIRADGVPERMEEVFARFDEPTPIRGNDPDWMAHAICASPHVDTDLFFGPWWERAEDRVEREQKAKNFCAMCPVRPPCLEHALATREAHGVWGGATEAERRAMLGRSIAV